MDLWLWQFTIRWIVIIDKFQDWTARRETAWRFISETSRCVNVMMSKSISCINLINLASERIESLFRFNYHSKWNRSLTLAMNLRYVEFAFRNVFNEFHYWIVSDIIFQFNWLWARPRVYAGKYGDLLARIESLFIFCLNSIDIIRRLFDALYGSETFISFSARSNFITESCSTTPKSQWDFYICLALNVFAMMLRQSDFLSLSFLVEIHTNIKLSKISFSDKWWKKLVSLNRNKVVETIIWLWKTLSQNKNWFSVKKSSFFDRKSLSIMSLVFIRKNCGRNKNKSG